MAKRTGSGRAGYRGRDRMNPLRVSVTQDEREAISARAAEAGLSVASYLRATALGARLGSVLDHAAVNDLVRVADDQGRLGELLKLCLDESRDPEVRRLLGSIEAVQTQLADLVARV